MSAICLPRPDRRKLRPALLLPALLLTTSCAWFAPRPLPAPPPQADTVETHDFVLASENAVVGQLFSVGLLEGDALSDIARHYGLGYQEIVEANPELDPWAPKAGTRALVPLQFVLPDAPRKGLVVNLAAMRLFYFYPDDPHALSTWPLGIGREGSSTPLGLMTVERKRKNPVWYPTDNIRRRHAQEGDPLPAMVPAGPDNPLGEFALYLSKPSYLIHGTNKPYSIGFRASNGCIRLYPEDIARLYREVPAKTPVRIVNQPYLLGWLDGELYLEAHRPFEEIDAKQARKSLLAKLKRMAKTLPRPIDWTRVEEALQQTRGFPIPILQGSDGPRQLLANARLLTRPDRLYRQPKTPETLEAGWRLKVLETPDAFEARRLAAMLNHLGPRIPARALAQNGRQVVMAGPFPDRKLAREAARTLKMDFELDGALLEPGQRILSD